MAHPARQESVEELQAQLDRPATVVYDANPVPSADTAQRWLTGRRAWEAADPTSDWTVVIQDDITVSQDFTAAAERALMEVGTEGCVSFYAGTGRPDQQHVRRAIRLAERRQYSWWCIRSLNWGPAIALPTKIIPDMLDWCGQEERWQKPTRYRSGNYDYRIGVYVRDILKWRTWYTNPSLVEHKGLPSLVGHDTGAERRAHNFHAGSGLDIDWTKHGGLRATL